MRLTLPNKRNLKLEGVAKYYLLNFHRLRSPDSIMATAGHANDEFIHQLAIKLSRVLNIVNPNDLLAQRVVDIAKTNPLDDFTKGIAHTN